MKPTIEYIEKKFGEFNHLIFDDRLPLLPIQLSNAKSFLGMLVYKKRRKPFGRVEKYDFRLRISTRMDLPEAEVEDTIIHEMIHYYIDFNGIKDTSAHGQVFRQMMSDINTRFGRHITITHKSTPEQRQQLVDTRKRWHVVAVVKFHDGRTGIKILPRIRQRIITYRNLILTSKEIKDVELYMSNDPYFNAYPVSSALKVHIVEPIEFESHLLDKLEIRS
ncbi:MAG: SprT-like domain-containing protein [Prevotellaceae bacterium]|nr:SprT-like domain-containing protein [Prevotellaceae bacterium]